MERKLLPDNPARRVRMPTTDSPPTMPFTRDGIVLMIRACDGYGEGGGTEEHRRVSMPRARALLFLLLYSGLRISDAALVRSDRLNLQTRKLLLRMEETRVPAVPHTARRRDECVDGAPAAWRLLFLDRTRRRNYAYQELP